MCLCFTLLWELLKKANIFQPLRMPTTFGARKSPLLWQTCKLVQFNEDNPLYHTVGIVQLPRTYICDVLEYKWMFLAVKIVGKSDSFAPPRISWIWSSHIHVQDAQQLCLCILSLPHPRYIIQQDSCSYQCLSN